MQDRQYVLHIIYIFSSNRNSHENCVFITNDVKIMFSSVNNKTGIEK